MNSPSHPAEAESTKAGLGKGARTRLVILDSAEALFADRGYDGVTVRNVADHAGVNLGVVTYHFPSKEVMFEAVVERRAGALTGARRKALAAIEHETLETLLDAFLRPFRDFVVNGGEGWRSYGRLIAHLAQDARWTALVTRHFGALGAEMIERIERAVPGLDRQGATRGYVHLIAVMVGVFASTGLLDRFSQGKMISQDIDAAYPHMIRFVAGGIRALAA